MESRPRSARTERLLALRLEELARALEHPGAPRAAAVRLLELASVATGHAVALDLLSSERAERVWHDAREEHPVLETVELGQPGRPPASAVYASYR